MPAKPATHTGDSQEWEPQTRMGTGSRGQAGEARKSTTSKGTNWPRRVRKQEKEVVNMNLFNLGSGICLPCSTTLFEMPLDVVLKILKKKKK